MPPWDHTGVPLHFNSSTISGSASCMIARTFASIFPRQPPTSVILSMNADADSAGTVFFILSSKFQTILAAPRRGCLGAELLGILCNQPLPAGRLHRLPGYASDWSSTQKLFQNVESNVPARRAPRDEAAIDAVP